MRILYFHQHFGTPAGSSGTRSYEFARALIARGHRVTLVCGAHAHAGLNLPTDPARNWARGDVDGIDVIVLPLPYSNRDGLARRTMLFLRFAWRSIGIAWQEPHDLLFATSTPLTAGLPGIVAKLLGRPARFVFEVRDLWPELPRALGMRNPLLLGGMSILEWLSYRLADACIGLSPGIVEGIRRRAPQGRRIGLVPNGCDLDVFRPGNRQELRLPGVAPGDFVAVFTGAHGIANGLDAVLNAAAVLQRRGKTSIRLVFIGDGREKPRLQERARVEGLTNCLFLPPMRKTELARVTGQVDCGLMILANVPAFYYGTSPNKFFDYVAAGVPVVNNYPGWLAEMITRERCGVVVPPEQPEALADGLCSLAAMDPAERREMGLRGRAFAERDFARDRLAGDFVSLLESVSPSPQ
jgi:glycosyltransferase involved in cell wall biosynthesis